MAMIEAFRDYEAVDAVAEPEEFHRKKERLRLTVHRYARADKPHDPRKIGRRRRRLGRQ